MNVAMLNIIFHTSYLCEYFTRVTNTKWEKKKNGSTMPTCEQPQFLHAIIVREIGYWRSVSFTKYASGDQLIHCLCILESNLIPV